MNPDLPQPKLIEIIELANHPWFLGCQFHPEFKSTPMNPHPLFKAFIGAALTNPIQSQKTGPTKSSAINKPKASAKKSPDQEKASMEKTSQEKASQEKTAPKPKAPPKKAAKTPPKKSPAKKAKAEAAQKADQ
jgi:hypothetical protein